MYTLIIAMIIGGMVGLIINRDEWLKKSQLSCNVIVGSVIAFFLTVFVNFCYLGGIMPDKIAEYETNKQTLNSFTNSDQLKGSFYVLSGVIGTDDYYKYMAIEADGGKQFHKVLATDAKIYEENRTDGYVVYVMKKKIYFEKTSNWIPFPGYAHEENEFVRYAFHVPVGTAPRGFRIDFK